MNDERLRWMAEEVAKPSDERIAPAGTLARWCLGREVGVGAKRRLDREYAATFKLRRERGLRDLREWR